METALDSIAMTERTQSIETGQEPIAFRICGGVAGKAAMAPASPQALTPSGLVVQQVLLSRGANEGRLSARSIAQSMNEPAIG